MAIAKRDGSLHNTKITKLYSFEGLKRVDETIGRPGDILAIAGVEGITIGETVTSAETPEPLPPIQIDEPTIAMAFTINTSPFAGREGQWVTSRNLRERLDKELLTNVSIRVEELGHDTFKVMGRGELQLAILIEMMRREGYELAVGKPEILTRTIDGKLQEPRGTPDHRLPRELPRRGDREARRPQGQDDQDGQPRLRPRAPGIPRPLARPDRPAQRNPHRHARHGHHELALPRLHRVAGRNPHRAPPARWWRTAPARTTGYAIFNLQERGEIFVAPGTEVYEGMIVGENARDADLDVNIVKEKKLTNMRASTADEAIRLVPPRILNLEQAIEFIRDDEFVEVTPTSIRLRKKILKSNQR